jgi:hypothetical protein
MQPDHFLLSHDSNHHGALTQTNSFQIQPLPANPAIAHIAFHGYHSLNARDLINHRPDTLHHRLLTQKLLSLISDTTDPIHVSTLYALIPQSSPFQIHRSLNTLLRTEQIIRPSRGFYAKPSANPVFVPPNKTATTTSKTSSTKHSNATAATTLAQSSAKNLVETAARTSSPQPDQALTTPVAQTRAPASASARTLNKITEKPCNTTFTPMLEAEHAGLIIEA